eukprot:scaffold383342_cov32-Prasinocladus_malaysianus.AAC.1
MPERRPRRSTTGGNNLSYIWRLSRTKLKVLKPYLRCRCRLTWAPTTKTVRGGRRCKLLQHATGMWLPCAARSYRARSDWWV